MAPRTDPDVGCIIPVAGQWPVDPQEDVAIREDRLWIDGCFDFFHHGHAGVMLQSRRFGDELLVGLHNDGDIAANKGPTVMNLAERVAAVNACRFSTLCVPHAPYVTSIPWISHYGCQYVTHGDDITSDASGEDCYRFVKKAGRMKIVPRTPGISTTDLVGRMLACTKDHFIDSLVDCFEGREDTSGKAGGAEGGEEMHKRIQEYAAAFNGIDPFVEVYSFAGDASQDSERFTSLVSGTPPRPDQRMVYVDGGFDLFSSGHIAFLETVAKLEPGAFIVAGVHDDSVINQYRGVNYPIMNIFERGLCVVQCTYIHSVIFGAPYTPTEAYLRSLPFGRALDAVYHGRTAFMPTSLDPYADAKAMRIFKETSEHEFQNVNAAQIVQRIMDRREEYEARQKKKGQKAVGEEAHHKRELLEREAEKERQRRLNEA
ncbi:hypothetical protein DOTSEDRAFT_72194 [Dothistroma septosporum NZE10]|uniref:ethanolamine-phosphate cytidylyltransferase n=1 Tax=Dothistroma septosporum (strain NZE10 / CBS 128990) TaxID=675120 RepID=N1PQF8_DOTSN|nr:hypothetical protein DOTSEDRAFT_72194 [Dothistroma septosporum NZE10]